MKAISCQLNQVCITNGHYLVMPSKIHMKIAEKYFYVILHSVFLIVINPQH